MLIYLFGEDTKRSREKLKALTEKFLKEVDPSGINITVCDGSKVDAESLGQLLRASPFLARRRMVVVENLFANKNEDVLAVLEHFVNARVTSYELPVTSSSDDTIVILWEDGVSTKKLAKKLAKLPLAECFKTLDKEDTPEWITQKLKQSGVAIELPAARALAERFPANTWALATELHKLAAYAKRELQATSYKLQANDIDLLSGTFAEEPLYMLTAAIEAGSLKDAAQRLHTFLEAGTPMLVLMSLMSKLLGNLAAEKQGTLPSLKLHPYVEKKVAILAQRVSTNTITELIERFLTLEYKMKTTRHNGEVEVLRFLGYATVALGQG